MVLAIAPAAQAAPIHPALSDSSIAGFDHACGVATDSEGDVYVSSAGESKVRIFAPSHDELGSVLNSNDPCGLAVDGNGNLYVSEEKTGNVVRYEPAAYPFVGTPAYGAPTAIDSSGEAKGISVDPFDDRLYVAKGDRVDTYNADGTLGEDEVQWLKVRDEGGSFRLAFNGSEKSGPIPSNASVAEIKAALEGLSTIGSGEVSVTEGPSIFYNDFLITFTGSLGSADLPSLTADVSELTGAFPEVVISEQVKGFDGHVGIGTFGEATGVAAYTYASSKEQLGRYLFVADSAGAAADRVYVYGGRDIRTLKLHETIEAIDHDRNPTTPDQKLGFGPIGAQLAADQGTCPPAEQACTAGHFFLYDDAHQVVDEFEASGQYLTQISDPEFADGEPTGVAVDRSGGSREGTIYVTSGAAGGAKVLAFGPLPLPSRPPRPDLSFDLTNACGVAVDRHGNRYLAADTSISVFSPDGTLLTTITDAGRPCDLAVDSAGNLYALDRETPSQGDEKVVYYAPDAFPPVAGVKYSAPTTVATAGAPSFSSTAQLTAIDLNPGNDHLFVTQLGQTIELEAASKGSGIVDPSFASDLSLGSRADIAVYGANGNVYVSAGSTVVVLDPAGEEILTRISGAGSPQGPLSAGASIAVDQSNGHAILFHKNREAAEEYEASGTFVAEFGSFENVLRQSAIAVDNSGGPKDGSVFVAFFEDVTAFGPLVYGEPPIALTGAVSSVGGGSATLNGTVDPRGFDVEDCNFQYTPDSNFLAEGFAGAEEAPCAPGPTEIGAGTGAVAVHADLSGLDSDQRYRCRLIATNKYGTSEGQACLFGPPLIIPRPPLSISYAEEMLRATIDPSGLTTKYHFEYGTDEGYGQTTSEGVLQPSSGPITVEVPIFGLQQGTTYHFRVFAENEAKSVEGPDQTFATGEREGRPPCPNDEFRSGRSANLPDCRAYELVTPADTRGATPYATTAPSGFEQFNNWLVAPRGEGAGESVAFFVDGTLPGFNGNGRRDGYRAGRGSGAHPIEGWTSDLFGPTYREAGGSQPAQEGVASDQENWFWAIQPGEAFEGTLEEGAYLRTPAGFEPLGRGSLGTDPKAEGRLLTAGAGHVVFSSEAHLESDAAPAGTTALYDRTPGGPTRVISLRPDDSSFEAGEDASYVGATEDGSAVAFKANGALYVRRNDTETVKVADGPSTFAGLSDDGGRVFYTDAADGTDPGSLFALDLGSSPPTQIAEDSIFVSVSADGSHVYLTSEEALDEGGEGTEGADNLYVWDGETIRFVAALDPSDLSSSLTDGNLTNWSRVVSFGDGVTGRALDPSRSTPDGEVFVFQSHADLTPHESEGHVQIYRYDAGAETLLCISCNPTGAAASGDSVLQSNESSSTTSATTLIPNVVDDGQAVFFESENPLLPEDANSVRDVYEWKAGGGGDCKGEGGCLALISSGQGDQDNFLYGMSADGHDVFVSTLEKLVDADIAGSPSIYDARVEGGIPQPSVKDPCFADGCRAQGSPPVNPPSPASMALGDDGVGSPRHCGKGKRRVVRHGEVRCVKKHHKRHTRKSETRR
jgi:hypothetical protein